jgi:hypothetical protein
MGVQARDLRPARETADRVGQRPIHEKHCRLRRPTIQISDYAAPTATETAIIAVHVVTEGAFRRHIAIAVVLVFTRVCRARRRHATEHTCTRPCAVPGPSTHSEPGQLTAQLHCHEPTAIDGTLPARARLPKPKRAKNQLRGPTGPHRTMRRRHRGFEHTPIRRRYTARALTARLWLGAPRENEAAQASTDHISIECSRVRSNGGRGDPLVRPCSRGISAPV